MFAVPDLTVPSPGALRRSLPPATLARAVAADHGSWSHLLRYQPDAPSRVRLPLEHPDLELWLCGWLPGQSAQVAPPEGLVVVVSGVVTEFGDDGAGRTLRAGQTRVYGRGRRRRLLNQGEWSAVTVHAAFPEARRQGLTRA
jgi:hypothetical protein